ncbi:MAG: hypothetical protein ACFFHV_20320 [Promethearchaeota archaeon]
MKRNEIVEIYLKQKTCDLEYNLDKFERLGIDFIVYYYEDGGYEGLGVAFLKWNNKWYYHNMEHCSCYGPFDTFEGETYFNDLESLLSYAKHENWSGYDYQLETIYQICIEHFGG